MMADYLRSRVSSAVRSFLIVCLVIVDIYANLSGFILDVGMQYFSAFFEPQHVFPIGKSGSIPLSKNIT